MAKLIAGASIASTAGDTPPKGSNLPTGPINKVQGIPSGIRNMPESGSRSAPSHPQVSTASRKSASVYAAAKLHLIALHISDYSAVTRPRRGLLIRKHFRGFWLNSAFRFDAKNRAEDWHEVQQKSYRPPENWIAVPVSHMTIAVAIPTAEFMSVIVTRYAEISLSTC